METERGHKPADDGQAKPSGDQLQTQGSGALLLGRRPSLGEGWEEGLEAPQLLGCPGMLQFCVSSVTTYRPLSTKQHSFLLQSSGKWKMLVSVKWAEMKIV